MRFVDYTVTALLIVFIVLVSNMVSPTKNPPYSEIYMNDNQFLPRYILAGNSYDFSFSVENHEQQNQAYFYRVLEESIGENKTILEGNFVLRDNTSQIISLNYSTSMYDQNIRLKIELINKNQSLYLSFKSLHPDGPRTFYCDIDVSDYDWEMPRHMRDPIDNEIFDDCLEE